MKPSLVIQEDTTMIVGKAVVISIHADAVNYAPKAMNFLRCGCNVQFLYDAPHQGEANEILTILEKLCTKTEVIKHEEPAAHPSRMIMNISLGTK